MLNRFLQMQEDQLASLAVERQAHEQRKQLEQQRLEQLQFFQNSLNQHCGTHALSFQNRTAMQGLLGLLVDSQEQELLLSDLELQAKQREVLNQFGKVKGLQQLQKRQERRKTLRDKKQEQTQLDDWLNGARRSD